MNMNEDAMIEEHRRTPKRKARPMEDWDRYPELHENKRRKVNKNASTTKTIEQ